jgi:predicted PurR-regulated permease PerM
VIAQLFAGWILILTPWIQSRGNQLGVNPVLFAFYLGGAMLGFWGPALAIPVTACLKIIWDDFGRERLRLWSEEH